MHVGGVFDGRGEVPFGEAGSSWWVRKVEGGSRKKEQTREQREKAGGAQEKRWKEQGAEGADGRSR